jgi:hypothetical protein
VLLGGVRIEHRECVHVPVSAELSHDGPVESKLFTVFTVSI